MTSVPQQASAEALARLEAWRRPLFDRLPADPAANKALRRGVSRLLTDLFEALVVRQAPPLVLEVGAHEATFSTEIKQALPKARVVAFEGNPFVYDRQKARLAATGVDYVHACVADSPGPKRFLTPMEGDRKRLRMGSLLAHQPSREFVESEVEGVTLDGFLGEAARSPNAIWLDVEGATGAVLDGGPVTLSNCTALLVELETEARWEGQRLEGDISAQLSGYGLVPAASDIQAHWQFNLLFLRAGDAEAARACDDYRRAAEALIAASEGAAA